MLHKAPYTRITISMVRRGEKHPMYELAELIRDGVLGFELVYCMEDDKFYKYIDNYWQPLHPKQLMKCITENIEEINNKTPSVKQHVITHLSLMVLKELQFFNSSRMLNFPEGEFNPIENKIYPHDKTHYSTSRLPYNYNVDAKCPIWIKTLNEIFEGNQLKINLLQEFFGYCFTYDVTQKKALLIMGDTDTGKSTILFILKDLLGEDNYSTVALKNIMHPQFTPLMINKLVNLDTDVSKNAQDFEEGFKKITSGEEIDCNQKFIQTFSFVPYCRMVMAANKFPHITDQSSAFYQRLLLIPCNRRFSEEEKDRNLRDKLKQELSGIFNWCIEGLHRLHTRGRFEEHSFMKEAVEELREESNPVDVFFKENIVTDVSGNAFIEKLELYNIYKRWCVENGNAPMANNKFGATVFAKYSKFTPKTTSDSRTGRRIWRNLKLINHAEPQGEQIKWQD